MRMRCHQSIIQPQALGVTLPVNRRSGMAAGFNEATTAGEQGKITPGSKHSNDVTARATEDFRFRAVALMAARPPALLSSAGT